MKKILFILILTLTTLATQAQIPSGATKLPKTAQDTIYGSDGAFSPSFDGKITVKDTVRTGAIQFYDNTNLKSAFPGYIDLVAEYGADTTGVTSITSVLVQAATRNKAIYIRAGRYLLSTTANMPDSTVIFGDGRLTVIQIGNNCRGIRLKNYSKIQNITFLGTKFSAGTNQTGIAIDSSSRCYISGCYFYNLAGAGIRVLRTNLSGLASYNGNMIENCAGDSNTVGISFSITAEYSCVTNCIFSNGDTGIYMEGGNNSVIGGVYNGNGTGLWINGGTNSGHSVASGVTMNHNLNENLRVTSNSLGYTFSGCMFYSGTVRVIGSTNTKFIGCDISSSAFQCLTSVNTSLINCLFEPSSFSNDTSKVSIQMSVNGNTYFLDRKSQTAFIVDVDTNTVNLTGNNVNIFNLKGTLKNDSATFFGPTKTITATAYTVSIGDEMLLVDATAGNITITLPTAASSANRILNIKKIDASVNTVTIDGDGGELIDGVTTQVISSQWANIEIKCNGTAWYIR